MKAAAEMFWDAQEFRKAMENKARSGQVDPEFVAHAAKYYRKVEDLASGAMVNAMRDTVPAQILDWQQMTPGIGEHTLARLLGTIGDPYLARPQHWEDRPGAKGGKDDPLRVLVDDEPYVRNLAKLWAYCGIGDPARKRRAGMTKDEATALGNWKAKTALWLMAVAIVKSPSARGTRYRKIYDEARLRYANRVHDRPCPQCKGSSKVGDPWKGSHQHAAALRLLGKEILRDLWEIARDIHQAEPRAA
jgi:hypothetical protein